jgi:DNA ligase (NAD+)
MDIEHVGTQLAAQLVEKGLVKDCADLYSLKRAQIEELERMAEKSAENVISAIDASRKRPLSALVFALGIRHVGTRVAEILARRYPALDELASASEEELKDIHEVGPVVAASIHGFFRQPAAKEVVAKLRRAGVNLKRTKEETPVSDAGNSRASPGRRPRRWSGRWAGTRPPRSRKKPTTWWRAPRRAPSSTRPASWA